MNACQGGRYAEAEASATPPDTAGTTTAEPRWISTAVINARSGGEPVLVEKAAEPVNSLYAVSALERPHRQEGYRLFEVDGAVRAFLVVMGHELAEDALGMSFTADENPVQALGPGCEHEPLGERVRLGRSERCLYDLGAHRPHHLVKGPGELAVPVADQEAERPLLVLESGHQVPGLLGDPWPDRVRGYPGQVDNAALDVDEK